MCPNKLIASRATYTLHIHVCFFYCYHVDFAHLFMVQFLKLFKPRVDIEKFLNFFFSYNFIWGDFRHPCQTVKTTVIRRIAVRETGVSRHHGGPIQDTP